MITADEVREATPIPVWLTPVASESERELFQGEMGHSWLGKDGAVWSVTWNMEDLGKHYKD